MKKQLLLACLVSAALSGVCQFSLAQSDSELPSAVYLYDGDAPGSKGMSDIPKQVRPGDDRVVTQVHRPLLYPYLPAEGCETGMAVIVAPGGGHHSLWSTHEGHHPAKYFADHGIAAFVLEYRLAEEKDSKYTVDEHALGDMQRAIRLVRDRANEWNVDPNRVGVMGFSAGGEIAALSGMRFDAGDHDADGSIAKQSSRPDFVALIYPGRSHRYEPQPESPQTFIVAGFGDRRDISEGMADVYLKYKRAKVPTELHIYSNAGHGFGLREGKSGSVTKWVDRFIDWAGDRKLIETKNFTSQTANAASDTTAEKTSPAVNPPAAPEGWSDGFLYANGVRLHYYQTPAVAEKPPLVMVHGITDNGLCWTTLALELQDQFNITMLDARGHGLSDPFTANDDADTLIKDVVAAVEALKLKQPILMGHSMGAHTVMRLAAEYPQLPKAVVMLDPLLPGAGNRGGPPRSGRDESRVRERNREESAEQSGASESNDRSGDQATPKRLSVSMFGSPEDLVAQNNYSFDDLVAKCRRDSPKWDLIDCQYWALSKKQYHGAYSREAFAVMTGAMQIGDSLKNIQIPALVLKADAADQDRVAHQKLVDTMPNGKLVHVDDAGHNLHHDQLNRTFETLSQFLSKVNAP